MSELQSFLDPDNPLKIAAIARVANEVFGLIKENYSENLIREGRCGQRELNKTHVEKHPVSWGFDSKQRLILVFFVRNNGSISLKIIIGDHESVESNFAKEPLPFSMDPKALKPCLEALKAKHAFPETVHAETISA
ncbi:MAG: hypothetical protein KGR16_06340 [Verrucomicrobia bacterium]|nr:hypothetical protein [Verrucomicrobiota bacterium]